MGLSETGAESLAYWQFRGLQLAAARLPEPVARRGARAAAALAWLGMPRARAVVATNHARVLGLDPAHERIRRTTRETFDLYARYWVETFVLPTLPAETLMSRTEISGLSHLDEALARGRGCLLVSGHFGNWDLGGAYLAARGYRIAAVAEDLRPARLARLFERHRARLGIQTLPLHPGAGLAKRLLTLLADNWAVALLADRDLTGHGTPVEMFGATRSIPTGPAWLSLHAGAPLIVGGVVSTGARWRIEMGPPVSSDQEHRDGDAVRLLSQRVASALERVIASNPAEWHLFRPGWDPA